MPLLLLVVVIVVAFFAVRKFMVPKKQEDVSVPVPATVPKRDGMRISVIGPKGAGKSELIKSVDGKKIAENVYTVVYNRKKYEVREMFEQNVDGVVFVVDASDIELSVQEWDKVKESVKGIPTVILGNKNDIAGAKSFAEISSALQIGAALLNGEDPDTEWPINLYMTSLNANFGFRPALKWLAQAVQDWKKQK